MGNSLVLLQLGLTAFFWAMMFHLGKYAVAFMSPVSIGGWRFLLAGAVLAPLLYWREGIDWAGLRRNALPLVVMALVGIGGFNIALFYGLRVTSPVNGALIIALSPALTVMLSALLQREAVSGRQWLGLGLALAGVAVVVSHGSLAALLALDVTTGDLLVFLASVAWAIYSTIPRRFIQGLAPLQITTATIVLGGLFMSLFAQEAANDFFTLPPLGVIGALLVMSLLGSVLAYIWWNDALRQIGAGKAAVFMNLVPIFATLIGVALGQPVLASHFVGTALVVGGVLCSSSRITPAPHAARRHSGEPCPTAK